MSQWGPPGQPGFAPPPPPSSPRARSRGPIVAVVAVVVILAVAAALVVAGVFDRGPDDTRGAGPEPEPTSSETSQEEEDKEGSEEVVPGVTIGTTDNPYAPGDSFTVLQDWTFTVAASDTDAWPDVAPQWDGRPDIDQYQPAPGSVFVMAPASMTYTGPPTDQGRIKAFTILYITPDGTLINPVCGRYGTTFEELDWQAVDDEPSDEGAVCAEVLPEQVEGGQWQITMYTIDDDGTQHLVEVYYALT